MSMKSKAMMVAMMAAAMAADKSILQSTVPVPEEGVRIIPVGTVIPKGMTEYEYSDGFKCYALNLKNATRKHEKWIKNHKTLAKP